MSVAGHWTDDPFETRSPAPCFKCATEPRMQGHVVCSSCHREERCHVCHPARVYEYGQDAPRRARVYQSGSAE